MYTFANAVSTCLAVSICCQRSTSEWYTTDRTTSGTMSTVTANSTIYAVSTGPTVRGSTVGALTQRFFPSNRPIDSSKRLIRTTSNVGSYTAGPTAAVNRRVNILWSAEAANVFRNSLGNPKDSMRWQPPNVWFDIEQYTTANKLRIKYLPLCIHSFLTNAVHVIWLTPVIRPSYTIL